MSDPIADLPSWAEKLGWVTVTILGLVWVIRFLFKATMASMNNRITTLERLDKENKVEIRNLQTEILRRTDEHAKVNLHMASVIAEAMRDHAAAIKTLGRSLSSRPCFASSDEVSATQGETSRLHKALSHVTR